MQPYMEPEARMTFNNKLLERIVDCIEHIHCAEEHLQVELLDAATPNVSETNISAS